MAWLEGQRKMHLASPVIYRRGNQTAVVLATLGRTQFEVADGQGFFTNVESRDYLIAAADLVSAGFSLPQRGDQIEEASGSVTIRCEVLPFGNGPVWRYCDPHRNTLRVHTKYATTE